MLLFVTHFNFLILICMSLIMTSLIFILPEGITRLPILDGKIYHVEFPRKSSSLGITNSGSSDTLLWCVVVHEVFPDGLIASDGRLQPGDQIIEINGIDMTCASHAQVIYFLIFSSSIITLFNNRSLNINVRMLKMKLY